MKEGISTKLEKIFLEHYEEWCLVSYVYLQNKVEAEEVVQDVCVNILLRKQSTEILNLKAYITTAIKNRSLKRIKQLEQFETLNIFNNCTSPSSEEGIILEEKKLHLHNAVESLPNSTKKVFKLCIFGEQKYQNVADTLGISINTVKYHIKKAYKTLRIEMKGIHFSTLISVIFLLSYIYF